MPASTASPPEASDYLLSEHPVLESLGSHPHDDCQDHQEGALPQPVWFWSRTNGAFLLGSP